MLYNTNIHLQVSLSQQRADGVSLLKAPLSQCLVPLPLLNMLDPGCHDDMNYSDVNVKLFFNAIFIVQ